MTVNIYNWKSNSRDGHKNNMQEKTRSVVVPHVRRTVEVHNTYEQTKFTLSNVKHGIAKSFQLF